MDMFFDLIIDCSQRSLRISWKLDVIDVWKKKRKDYGVVKGFSRIGSLFGKVRIVSCITKHLKHKTCKSSYSLENILSML